MGYASSVAPGQQHAPIMVMIQVSLKYVLQGPIDNNSGLVRVRAWWHTGGCLNIMMSSYRYRDPHVKDYKNPLHLDVVDRYLRRMGDKTIPDEAPPSLESFYPP